MVELIYDEVEKSFINDLEKHERIVLSTCLENKVTSRMMCFVYFDQSIYFLTGRRSNKCKQIEGNSNVSLCIENIQLEGIATIIGHPSEKQNELISNIFGNKFPFYFNRFAHYKAAVFIKVKIQNVKQWKMEDGRNFYYCLDFNKGKALKHT